MSKKLSRRAKRKNERQTDRTWRVYGQSAKLIDKLCAYRDAGRFPNL